jgi:hypothetical protein
MDRIHLVYTRFSGNLISAPTRIHEVATAINSLNYLLLQSGPVIAAEGKELPLPSSIDTRLAECNLFLENYSSTSTSDENTEILWRTTATGFDDAARQLKSDLGWEADKLALSLIFTCT